VADIHPGLEVVESADELIENPDIDAVVLATPVRLHFEQARQALENGKHVLVEKPFTTSLREAAELTRLAELNERILMVGHTFEYTAAVNYIRDIVREGELGDLTYIRSLRVNLGLIRNDVNVLWDLAPHDVSILLYVLDRLPVTVQATGKARINRSMEDVASVTLDFGDELMANIIVSWLDPQKVRQMTLVGDRKMLVYDDVSATEKIRIYDKGIDVPRHYDSFGDFQYTYRYGDIVIPMLDEHEPLFVECRHFLQSCQLGKEPRSGARAGTAVTAVLAAANRSMSEDGEPVHLEEFVAEQTSIADWPDVISDLRSYFEPLTGSKAADLPVAETESTGGPGRTEAAERRRAIVVDPDETVRAFVADALTSFEPGFDVVTVSNTDEAAEWAGSFIPDLLVVNGDAHLNGAPEFVDTLLAAPASRHCKVLSIGHPEGPDVGPSRRRHATVPGTVSLSELMETVRSLLTD
jgi:predicted dehydrogenase